MAWALLTWIYKIWNNFGLPDMNNNICHLYSRVNLIDPPFPLQMCSLVFTSLSVTVKSIQLFNRVRYSLTQQVHGSILCRYPDSLNVVFRRNQGDMLCNKVDPLKWSYKPFNELLHSFHLHNFTHKVWVQPEAKIKDTCLRCLMVKSNQ